MTDGPLISRGLSTRPSGRPSTGRGKEGGRMQRRIHLLNTTVFPVTSTLLATFEYIVYTMMYNNSHYFFRTLVPVLFFFFFPDSRPFCWTHASLLFTPFFHPHADRGRRGCNALTTWRTYGWRKRGQFSNINGLGFATTPVPGKACRQDWTG